MDCIVPKAENSNEREYNSYLPTMVPSFSSFMEPKETSIAAFDAYTATEQRTMATYDAKGNPHTQSEARSREVLVSDLLPLSKEKREPRGSPESIHGPNENPLDSCLGLPLSNRVCPRI